VNGEPSKETTMPLSARDKTPKSFGCDFHHTNPQRRVPCVLGDMLAPLSADDIPPITPEAMASVQAALKLLADLVGDPDHNRFLAYGQRQDEFAIKARDILLTAKGLTGILRVEATPQVIKLTAHEGTRAAPLIPEIVVDDEDVAEIERLVAEERQRRAEIDRLVAEMSALPVYQGWSFTYEYPGYFCYSHPESPYSVFCTPDFSDLETVTIQTQDDEGSFYEEFSSDPKFSREGRTGEKIFELVRPTLDRILALPPELHVALTAAEISALKLAGEHVRVHMAHEHPWEIRDTAMGAIGKVLAAARAAQS
jgi:hypothetical protein